MTQRVTVDLSTPPAEVRDSLRDAGGDCPIWATPTPDSRSRGQVRRGRERERKSSGDDYGFSVGVRVLAGDRTIAPG